MNQPESSHHFARLTYEALFARAVGLLSGFLANIMIARALGADGKGQLTILAVWSSLLASFFSSGINLAVVFELGIRPWHIRRLQTWVTPYVAGATALVTALLFLFREQIGPFALPLSYFVVLFSIQLANNLACVFLVGLRNQSAINGLLALGSACYPLLVGMLLLLHGSLDVNTVACCLIGLSAMTTLLGFLLARKKSRRIVAERTTVLEWAPFLRYAAKSTAMAMGYLLYAQVIILVLSMRCTSAQVGVFSVAMVFMDTATVIPSMIAAFVLPRWAGLSNQEVSVRAGRVIRLTHPIVLAIAIGTALAATLFAGPVFGKDFKNVGMLAWIMVPGTWAVTGVTVITNYFLSQNRHRVPLTTAWCGALISGGLAWWCLPAFGCVGAAVIVSLGRMLVLGCVWLAFARTNQQLPRSIWVPGRDDFHEWSRVIQHSLFWIRSRLCVIACRRLS